MSNDDLEGWREDLVRWNKLMDIYSRHAMEGVKIERLPIGEGVEKILHCILDQNAEILKTNSAILRMVGNPLFKDFDFKGEGDA